MSNQFRRLQPQYANTREIAEVTNLILNGKTNNTGTITLETGGATTTTIYNERISSDSQIILVPLTISSASTGYQLPHGLFEHDTTQTFTANTPTVIGLAEAENEYGMSLASNQITVDYAGCYDVDLLCRFNNTDSQIHNAYVWFRVNGTDVPHSCTNITVPDKQGSTNGAAVAYVKHPLDLDADDYIEAVCAVDNAVVSLTANAAITSPYNRPSIPSAILTLCMAFPSQTAGTGLQPYISNRQKGQATVTHLPNSVSDNTWGYVIIG
jgi:hypothetical protein